MLVSFIIPAYNAADTIVRCLDSIYNLPLKRDEFEVIVIDDASSDNTIEVVEQYCQKAKSQESRVKSENLILIKQSENHRQGAARNRGVRVAKGEYICFADADDAVTEGIAKAIRAATENMTDITVYQCGIINEKGVIKEKEILNFEESQLFSGIEMQNHHPYWCSAPWGYVFNKDFLQRTNYPFTEDVLYEDSDFVAVHLYYAKRMTYSKELGYLAFYREGSSTNNMNYKNVADYIFLGARMLRFYETIAESREPRAKSQEVENFAEVILEGACFNVTNALKKIYKLHNKNEIIVFYERLDSMLNRKELFRDKNIYRYHTYWNPLAIVGIKNKRLSIILNTFLMQLYKIYKKVIRSEYSS